MPTWREEGCAMTTLQAVLLRAMLAWTPSLVSFSALLLRDIPGLNEAN